MHHRRSHRATAFRKAAMLSPSTVASEATCEWLTVGSDLATCLSPVRFLITQRPLAGEILVEARRTVRPVMMGLHQRVIPRQLRCVLPEPADCDAIQDRWF